MIFCIASALSLRIRIRLPCHLELDTCVTRRPYPHLSARVLRVCAARPDDSTHVDDASLSPWLESRLASRPLSPAAHPASHRSFHPLLARLDRSRRHACHATGIGTGARTKFCRPSAGGGFPCVGGCVGGSVSQPAESSFIVRSRVRARTPSIMGSLSIALVYGARGGLCGLGAGCWRLHASVSRYRAAAWRLPRSPGPAACLQPAQALLHRPHDA